MAYIFDELPYPGPFQHDGCNNIVEVRIKNVFKWKERSERFENRNKYSKRNNTSITLTFRTGKTKSFQQSYGISLAVSVLTVEFGITKEVASSVEREQTIEIDEIEFGSWASLEYEAGRCTMVFINSCPYCRNKEEEVELHFGSARIICGKLGSTDILIKNCLFGEYLFLADNDRINGDRIVECNPEIFDKSLFTLEDECFIKNKKQNEYLFVPKDDRMNGDRVVEGRNSLGLSGQFELIKVKSHYYLIRNVRLNEYLFVAINDRVTGDRVVETSKTIKENSYFDIIKK